MTRESQRSGLSATAVDRARPREKPYKLSDRDGLYLLVKPSGARYWRMNFKFHQLQRTASFGRYPEVSLAEARQRLLEARRQPSRASIRSIRQSSTKWPPRSQRDTRSGRWQRSGWRRCGWKKNRPKDERTAHGFRAMAATLLNVMGTWNPDAVGRQLAHAEPNSVRRAYARG